MEELKDKIISFVYEKYVFPLRLRGVKSLVVTSGEIHSAMRLSSRMPAVCNALRSNSIHERYHVRLVREIRLKTVKKDSSTNRFEYVLEELPKR